MPAVLKEKDPKRVKCGRKSRSKGKRGEREARDLLRKIFYPHGDGTVERTPMSGAWHGTPVMTGDLVFLKDGKFDANYPLFVEIKNVGQSALSPYLLLAGREKTIERWLAEAERKAAKGDLIPLVLWKVNFSPWFVALTYEAHHQLDRTMGRNWEVDEGDLVFLQGFDFMNITLNSFAGWIRPWVEHIYENPRVL